MATISNTPRPGFIYDSTDGVWYPIGTGTHSHSEIAKTIVDAKGDLIVGTAADTVARQAVGTDGQLLYADSTQTNGIKWADAPAAGSNWTLLNSGGTNLTGAQTVTVSGISGKDKIMVIVEAASSNNDGAFISVRLNSDTASNYYSYGNAVTPDTSYVNAANFTYYGGAASYIPVCQITDNTFGEGANGYVLLTGCNSSGVKIFTAAGGTYGSGAAGSKKVLVNVGGYYNSSSTISSISIFSSTGGASNLDAGKVYVYASA